MELSEPMGSPWVHLSINNGIKWKTYPSQIPQWLRQPACTSLIWVAITALKRTLRIASRIYTAATINRTPTGEHKEDFLSVISFGYLQLNPQARDQAKTFLWRHSCLGKLLVFLYCISPPVEETNKQIIVNLPRSAHSVNATFLSCTSRKLPFLQRPYMLTRLCSICCHIPTLTFEHRHTANAYSLILTVYIQDR